MLTCGGLQSNHARATALAGKQFGFDTHMLLIAKDDQVSLEKEMNKNFTQHSIITHMLFDSIHHKLVVEATFSYAGLLGQLLLFVLHWKHLIMSLKGKLISWKSMLLSLGNYVQECIGYMLVPLSLKPSVLHY